MNKYIRFALLAFFVPCVAVCIGIFGFWIALKEGIVQLGLILDADE